MTNKLSSIATLAGLFLWTGCAEQAMVNVGPTPAPSADSSQRPLLMKKRMRGDQAAQQDAPPAPPMPPAPPAAAAATARLGMRIASADAGIVVKSVAPGGPAADAGVQVGDVIVSIDGDAVASLPLPQITAMMRGPEGTTVKITFQRGDAEPFDRQLARRVMAAPAAEAAAAPAPAAAASAAASPSGEESAPA